VLTYLQVVTTGVEVLPTWACAVGPGRFDGHPSPLAECEGELVASEVRCCWLPEVEQCGHWAVVQFPRRVEGGPVLVAAPGRAVNCGMSGPSNRVSFVRSRKSDPSSSSSLRNHRKVISVWICHISVRYQAASLCSNKTRRMRHIKASFYIHRNKVHVVERIW